MQCPFCKEEIVDGAKVCRFCGRDQPLTREEKARRSEQRWWIALCVGVACVAIFILSAVISAQNRRAECERQITLTGNAAGITVDQCLEFERKAHGG
jgi:hypothetical protein